MDQETFLVQAQTLRALPGIVISQCIDISLEFDDNKRADLFKFLQEKNAQFAIEKKKDEKQEKDLLNALREVRQLENNRKIQVAEAEEAEEQNRIRSLL